MSRHPAPPPRPRPIPPAGPVEAAGRPAGGRVVVLVSGSGTLLQALLDDQHGFTVVAVVSDRPDVAGLERARAAGVATAVVRPADFPDRRGWDQGLARAVGTFAPDLVVLAGFMRIVGDPLLRQYDGRVVNTHPALLPSFPGAHGVRDALAHGVKVTGCSVILVDAGTDTGPIIAQRAVAVLDDDDEAGLHERIKVVERELLVDVVRRLATGGWQVEGRRVRLAAEPLGPPAPGVDPSDPPERISSPS